MNNTESIKTHFLAPDKSTSKKLQEEIDKLQSNELIRALFDAVTIPLVILNNHRQIVFANSPFTQLIGAEQPEETYGKRLGDTLRCIHAHENGEFDCGTTEFCKTCGAAQAMNSSIHGIASTQECRIIRHKNGSKGMKNALDLKTSSHPILLYGTQFNIFTIHDISNEKRRAALERIFFHDVLNTVQSIHSFTFFMRRTPPEEMLRFLPSIEKAVLSLNDEIQMQRQIFAAERNDLNVTPELFETHGVFKELQDLYSEKCEEKNLHIAFKSDSENIALESDRTLVKRVIQNMIKNAIEASDKDSIITVSSYKMEENHIGLDIHNNTIIPRETQLQIFNRSFSTKGSDRGLGTYSMKLLSERYLHGQVSFVSGEDCGGTTFSAIYPAVWPEK